MKILKRLLIGAGLVAILAVIPMESASAYWLGFAPATPAYGPYRNAYVYDPNYRWGTPEMKNYIRDFYRRGPRYANWRQYRRWPLHRRFGWW